MNWITNLVRPKITDFFQRKDMPENLWVKCPITGEMVFHKELDANMGVIPNSGYHMKISARERLNAFFDDGDYTDIEVPGTAADPLKFRDKTKYIDKLKDARKRTDQDDSILSVRGEVNQVEMVAVIHEMAFIGGSLGMAAGEAIIAGMEVAAREKLPLVLFAASGGARMQEGILSLMQLPRTTVAVQMMKDAAVPYIVVLTNPTTGGVSASYAMLGDIHIAEPGAVIGFAGRRVIEQTIREKLPEDFQTSEYLKEHGMVDMIVNRKDLKPTISRLVRMMMGLPALEEIESETLDSDKSQEVVETKSEAIEEDDLIEEAPADADETTIEATDSELAEPAEVEMVDVPKAKAAE